MATVAQLAEFDDVIDARSPSEYVDDHVPGAVSCPVLSDEERARVGTLYKQVSPFEARKIGAVLVARNVACQIEARFLDKPKDWRPLVYCWRGGQRSGSFTHILREIGWNAHRLDGGYKAWRRKVLDELQVLPEHLRFRIVAGATGSAKSRVLEALAEQGAQVLHLEALAAHKGSVLGDLPDAPQPSQKAFETRLHAALAGFDTSRHVFTEAESRRIGKLFLPDAMLNAIRAAECVRIEATLAARVDFLLRDYAYFLADPSQLANKLQLLRPQQGNETVDHWLAQATAGDFRNLVTELLARHYDPHYERSSSRNYAGYLPSAAFATDDLSPAGIEDLARRILAS